MASDVARNYCIAEHFNGQPIDVTVRFSNASGGPEQHDGWSDVRGMATRFLLPDGTATDLIATTLGEFFARNVEDFFEFTKLASSSHIKENPCGGRFADLLQLKVPRRDPYPNETTNARCGNIKLRQSAPVRPVGQCSRPASIGAPESYARAAYHAVHTFSGRCPMEFAALFAFPGSRSQAFATPIPMPCRTTIICSRNSKPPEAVAGPVHADDDNRRSGRCDR